LVKRSLALVSLQRENIASWVRAGPGERRGVWETVWDQCVLERAAEAEPMRTSARLADLLVEGAREVTVRAPSGVMTVAHPRPRIFVCTPRGVLGRIGWDYAAHITDALPGMRGPIPVHIRQAPGKSSAGLEVKLPMLHTALGDHACHLCRVAGSGRESEWWDFPRVSRYPVGG
jgi:hypothetical protein